MSIIDKLAADIASLRMKPRAEDIDMAQELEALQAPLVTAPEIALSGDPALAMEQTTMPPELGMDTLPFAEATGQALDPALAAPPPPVPPPASAPASVSASVSQDRQVDKYRDAKGMQGMVDSAYAQGMDMQSGLASESDAIYQDSARVAGDTALVEKDIAGQEQTLLDGHMAQQEELYAQAENRIGSIDEEIRQLASREPDPSRFWESRTDGQKALYFITMALQAFSNTEQPPAVSQMLMQFVDQDIAMQEKRMDAEMGAAKGRAVSAREMIQLGKDREESLYAARQARLSALYKMSMADVKAAGTTVEARKQRLGMAQSIAQEMVKLNQDMVTGSFKVREQQMERSRIALAARAQKAQEDAAKIKKAPPQLSILGAKLYVVGADGKEQELRSGTGVPVDTIPINESLPDAVKTKAIAQIEAQRALARSSATMYRLLEKKKGASDLMTDKEFIDAAKMYAVDARNAKESAVMTDQDYSRYISAVGLSPSPDGLTWTIVGDMKVSPKTVLDVVERADLDGAEKTSGMLYNVTAQPDGTRIRVRLPSGRDVLAQDRQSEAAADKQSRDSRVESYATPPVLSDNEKAIKQVVPFVGPQDSLGVAASDYAAKGRGDAATGGLMSDVYATKEKLEQRLAAAPVTERIGIAKQLERVNTLIEIEDMTQGEETPRQLIKRLETKLDPRSARYGGWDIRDEPALKEKIARFKSALGMSR